MTRERGDLKNQAIFNRKLQLLDNLGFTPIKFLKHRSHNPSFIRTLFLCRNFHNGFLQRKNEEGIRMSPHSELCHANQKAASVSIRYIMNISRVVPRQIRMLFEGNAKTRTNPRSPFDDVTEEYRKFNSSTITQLCNGTELIQAIKFVFFYSTRN